MDVHKKYQAYNSLFLNLDYQSSHSVGYLIPLLEKFAAKRLAEGKNPIEIFEGFYADNQEIIGDDKLGFMFKVIQYVERQVVLFDSVEDSVPPNDLEDQLAVQIEDLVRTAGGEEDRQGVLDALNALSVRIVLTAHPTQFYRPPVLNIIARLREQIASGNMDAVDDLLQQLGLTSLVNHDSPSPLDEALNIIHFCRFEYYDAIGEFLYELQKRVPGFSNPDLIRLGFWPCGDRDGNPYVTHEMTRKVIDALRMTLMKCYYKDFKLLRDSLTFRKVEPLVGACMERLYRSMFDASVIVQPDWLTDQLAVMRELLLENYEGLHVDAVDCLKAKVKAFGSHFASLDIRQDHSVHFVAVEEILRKNGLIRESLFELDQKDLVNLLTNEQVAIDPEAYEGLIRDTLLNIRQLPDLQSVNGEKGCHRYIISNSEDIFAVLFVFGLFRWIHRDDFPAFDIVPLFESVEGLAKGASIMDELYSLPVYRKHLEDRNNRQTIMLGFSDGTKDGGYIKANWGIREAKESLATVSKQAGIDAIFFDGRGGPPARGGGKTANFYAARSTAVANHDIQLTIQGQTITSTYGTHEKFLFNAEQMVTAGMISLNQQGRADLDDGQCHLMEELSRLSYDKYSALKQHPKFLPYLEHMTTLKYYSRAKIGSRPGKRNKSSSLTLSDLRAISYVGSWSQLKQNIPGYYGVGTAIEQLMQEGKGDALKALYRNAPFFRTLVDNCMMSLTKCYFELTAYIGEDSVYREFWQMLYEEYNLSKRMILEITGLPELMANEPASRASIAMREAIVLPLLLIQHYALQMINTGKAGEELEAFEKLVIRSLYGNINASRNSA